MKQDTEEKLRNNKSEKAPGERTKDNKQTCDGDELERFTQLKKYVRI